MSDVRVKFNLTNDGEGLDEDIFLPPAPLLAGAHVSGLQSYHDLYRTSINDADQFWRTVASELHFEQGTSKGLEWNFDSKAGNVFCKFMDGAKTNISYNCLERNLKRGLGDKTAYIFEGNEPTDTTTWTYKELHAQVVRFSAVLRSHGVKRGDVVALYLPMIPELAVAMLACARIGAMHSVVFAGFSAESLAARVVDARCRVLVTADGVFRGAKPIGLKSIADAAVNLAAQEDVTVAAVIMVEHLKRVTKPDGVELPKVVIEIIIV